MARKPNFTAADKKQIKQALIETLEKQPIIEIACQKFSISRMTFYRWMQEDKKFKKTAEESLRNGYLLINDLAESKLVSAIGNDSMPAITFWLRHHHHKYANRVELTAKSEYDDKLTPRQEKLMLKALNLIKPKKPKS